MHAHLSDEQLVERLAGPREENADAQEHLAACAACRSEEEMLRELLAGYAAESRAAAERPARFWQAQRAAIAARSAPPRAPWRLQWAAAAALLLLAATLLTRPPVPAPVPAPASAPNAQTANAPTAEADQALLLEVEQSVQRELPRALEPGALLTAEINKAGQPQTKRKEMNKGESR